MNDPTPIQLASQVSTSLDENDQDNWIEQLTAPNTQRRRLQ